MEGSADQRRGPLLLYGIPNCDRVRAARRWLDAAGIAYRFHDLRRDGAPTTLIARWIDTVGSDRLLNRRGRSWRALTPVETADLSDAKAVDLMATHPTVIRRPVLEGAGPLIVGFDPSDYAARLLNAGS